LKKNNLNSSFNGNNDKNKQQQQQQQYNNDEDNIENNPVTNTTTTFSNSFKARLGLASLSSMLPSGSPPTLSMRLTNSGRKKPQFNKTQ